MKKRILTSVIIGLLAGSVLMNAPVFAKTANKGFKDVDAKFWAKPQIETAVAKGYVSGYADGTFRANNKVTRAEFIRMVTDALKLPHSESGDPWYMPYVASMVDAGFYKKGDFEADYNGKITRLELVKIVVRASDLYYDDGKKADSEFVLTASQKGLLYGTNKGDLNLLGKVSRAEAIVFIERLLSVNRGETLPVSEDAIETATKMMTK